MRVIDKNTIEKVMYYREVDLDNNKFFTNKFIAVDMKFLKDEYLI